MNSISLCCVLLFYLSPSRNPHTLCPSQSAHTLSLTIRSHFVSRNPLTLCLSQSAHTLSLAIRSHLSFAIRSHCLSQSALSLAICSHFVSQSAHTFVSQSAHTLSLAIRSHFVSSRFHSVSSYNLEPVYFFHWSLVSHIYFLIGYY